MKNNYELMYILSSQKVDDKQLLAEQKKIKVTITKLGGKIKGDESWGKKELAYPIKKETNGYYTVLNFDLVADKISELDRILKLTDNILRFLITRPEKGLTKKSKTKPRIKPTEATKEAKADDKTAMVIERAKKKIQEDTAKAKSAKKAKGKGKEKTETISMAELDKKIDEVLKQELL